MTLSLRCLLIFSPVSIQCGYIILYHNDPLAGGSLSSRTARAIEKPCGGWGRVQVRAHDMLIVYEDNPWDANIHLMHIY